MQAHISSMLRLEKEGKFHDWNYCCPVRRKECSITGTALDSIDRREVLVPCSHVFTLSSVVVANNDHRYECNGRPAYLSVNYHRSAVRSNDKGVWLISRDEEAVRFYCAYDCSNASKNYPGLWHIENDNSYVGNANELIAFFPEPINSGENWHGYPFTFARKSPPDRIRALKDVAERLHKSGGLSLARAKKIRQGDL